MKFWDTILAANANLLRNKVRTILTIIAVFIGAFTIMMTAGVNAGVNNYINRQLGALGGNNLIIVQAKSDNSTLSSGPQKYDPNANKSSNSLGISINMLSENDVAKIKSVKGVQTVTPQTPVSITWAAGPNSQKFQMAVDPQIDGIKVDLAAGTAPDNASSSKQIDLPLGYAKAFGFKSDTDAIGKTITIAAATPLQQIETTTVTVVGIQNNSIVGGGGAWMNQTLTKWASDATLEGYPDSLRHQYVAVTVLMKDGTTEAQLNDAKASLQKLGFQALTVKDEIGTIATIINALTIGLIGFGAIALLAASFGVINTLFMAVQERTKEIGLMKAMGMSRHKVYLLFSVEAILLGFWGSVLGAAVAIITGTLISHVAAQTFLKDLHGFTLMQFPPVYVIIITVVIMLITFLSGTVPARRAAKQNPIDALRYE